LSHYAMIIDIISTLFRLLLMPLILLLLRIIIDYADIIAIAFIDWWHYW
jgi:hypothetical protein